jgi:hypothetical protein
MKIRFMVEYEFHERETMTDDEIDSLEFDLSYHALSAGLPGDQEYAYANTASAWRVE